MKKALAVVAACFALGLLLIPLMRSGSPRPGGQAGSADAEMTAKRQLVEQDIRRTDELCRTERMLALRQFMTDHAASVSSTGSAAAPLKQFKAQHAPTQQLIWLHGPGAGHKNDTEGTLPSAAADRLRPEIAQARKAVLAGSEYQSGAIQSGAGTYYVTAVPSGSGGSAIISVTKESILQEVANHQQKNLRTVPFPAGKNWKVEAADARTLKKVDVKHPEDNQGTSHYHKNEVVVRFQTPPTAEQLQQIRREIKAHSVRQLGYTYVFAADGMEATQMMDYFKKWHVLYTEPHYLYLTNEVQPAGDVSVPAGEAPNDRLYAKYQWNLPLIETENGWRIDRGSTEITVAVVDTGVDLNHPDLQGRLAPGYNVVNPGKPPQDDVGHGTHVTGVISALTNNGIGVAGMTWYNPVMPVKVLDATGAGSTYAVAEGIIWAADHGASVINLSLGNYADAQFLHDAVRYAFDKDVLLVSASGNDNTDQPGYPAAYPEVFAVAAIDDKRAKAPFSNFGDYIDVAAPGVSIASTFMGGRYAALSGTSMASPHVAAAAALIRSANPALKNTEVMDIMRRSAVDLGSPGHDAYYGYGQIDVVNALEMALPGAQAPVTHTAPELPNWFRRLLDLFRR